MRPAWDDPAFDWGTCDACLIRTTWDYMDRRDEFVRWAARVAKLTMLFNPPDVVRWNTHKGYLKDLAEKGVPVPPTVWLNTGSTVDVRELLTARGWDRAFIKPVIGATSRETLRFDASDEGVALADAHLRRLLPVEALMMQPYLPSVETEGELSMIFFDGEFSHAVRKRPVPGDYRVQDDFGATDEPARPSAAEIDLGQRVIDAVDGDLLYARVDCLRDSTGAWLVSEFEAVEPSLFFRHAPAAAERLADGLCRRVSRNKG